MINVYLLVTDVDTASNIRASVTPIGAIAVNGCAWLVPWSQSFTALQSRIRTLLPCDHQRLVIAEITGDYVAM